MRIKYINNVGSGFADYQTIEGGTTIDKFFQSKMPDQSPEDYLIRVNHEHVTRDYVLQEDDKVSITPRKIEGAACRNC